MMAKEELLAKFGSKMLGFDRYHEYRFFYSGIYPNIELVGGTYASVFQGPLARLERVRDLVETFPVVRVLLDGEEIYKIDEA